MKPNNYPFKRNRVTIDCSEPVLTDQSFKNSSNINTIMAQYAKTGLLNEPNKAFAKYQDNTLSVPLEDAYKLVSEATELFRQLPSSLRKQMDDDPKNLESFLSDPDNYDQLVKHGVLTPKADEGSPSPSPQPSVDMSPNPKPLD